MPFPPLIVYSMHIGLPADEYNQEVTYELQDDAYCLVIAADCNHWIRRGAFPGGQRDPVAGRDISCPPRNAPPGNRSVTRKQEGRVAPPFIKGHPLIGWRMPSSVRTTGTRFHNTAFTLATLYAHSSTRFLPPRNTDTQMVKNSTQPCATNCAITITVSATRFPSVRNRSNRSIASFLGFMVSTAFPGRLDTHQFRNLYYGRISCNIQTNQTGDTTT